MIYVKFNSNRYFHNLNCLRKIKTLFSPTKICRLQRQLLSENKNNSNRIYSRVIILNSAILQQYWATSEIRVFKTNTQFLIDSTKIRKGTRSRTISNVTKKHSLSLILLLLLFIIMPIGRKKLHSLRTTNQFQSQSNE